MEASLGTDSIVLQRRRQLDVLVAKNYANSGRTRCSQSVPLIALALAIIGIIAINFHAAESILKGEIESMHRTILLPERHWRPSPVAFPNDNGSVTTKALLQEIDTKTDILLDRQKVTNETKFKYSPSLEVEKVYKTASTSPITAKSYGSSPESNIGSPASSSSGRGTIATQALSKNSSNIPALYGANTAPLIAGYDTCVRFRMAHANTRAPLVLGPAGLFNTGTNYLEALLRMNCRRGGKSGSIWQVPWGKHNPVEWRGSHYAPSGRSQNISRVMPVMMIKDPLTWMKSMCRKPYAARFKKLELCPSPLEATATVVAFQPDRKISYKSLLHLWGKWNRAYVEMKTPHLIVRYEDILFNPEETVSKICACTGGTMSGNFRNLSKQAKTGKGHGDGGNDRAKALAIYGNATKRLEGYTTVDVQYLLENWDEPLVRYFHYNHGLVPT